MTVWKPLFRIFTPAGDAVQVKHFVTDEDTLISLAGPGK